ncbi:MAG: sugar phosphate isomerase/epimerase family protein [Acidimicrobiales bacterium]
MRWPLGVVYTVYGRTFSPSMGELASADGFDHLDVRDPCPPGLAVAIGDRLAYPDPRPGCSTPAPLKGEGAWDRAVAGYRGAPGSRVEPWLGSVVDSIEAVRALLDSVPGLRLLVDCGHVVAWGEDPVELLGWADHVQIRQARRGVVQALEGDVDLAAVFRRLDQLDYRGRLSIEYFDVPEMGWGLEDPRGHALALAEQVRPLLAF